MPILKLLAAIVLLLLAAVLAIWFREQDGYVLIAAGGWSLETSLLFFIGMMFAAWLAVSVTWALVKRLLSLNSGLRQLFVGRRQERSRSRLVDGLILTAEGKHKKAESLLMKDVDASDLPLLHYLFAAVNAQRRGSFSGRDHYLRMADRTSPRARFSVGLLQAQLQMEAKQWEQAFATLNYLEEKNPRHPRVQEMLFKCARRLREDDKALRLIPELLRSDSLKQDEALRLRVELAENSLKDAKDVAALRKVWDGLPREAQAVPSLVAAYARALIAAGDVALAESVVRGRLQKGWDEILVYVYGDLPLDAEAAGAAFSQVEKWLAERPDQPDLLLAAGKLALRNQIWGRARSYLEAAAARGAHEAQALLGGLLEQLGETEAALAAYRACCQASGGHGLSYVINRAAVDDAAASPQQPTPDAPPPRDGDSL